VEQGVAQRGAAAHAAAFPVHVSMLQGLAAGPSPFSEASSPWVDLVVAVLGSPKVHFTSSGQRMARWAGLQAVIEAWRTAQALRADGSSAAAGAGFQQEGEGEVLERCLLLASKLTQANDQPLEAVVRVVDAGRADDVIAGVASVDYAFLAGF